MTTTVMTTTVMTTTVMTTTVIDTALGEIPKSVACGIVDMDSGMLLDVRTVDSHPRQVLDLVADDTRDPFEGDVVTQIEDMFTKVRGGQPGDHYFQEMLIASTNLWHYFGRLKATPAVVFVVVCRGDANVGLLLDRCREIRNGENP